MIGVPAPHGSRTDDAFNDYVFERRVFQDNGDGTASFGRIDAYRKLAARPWHHAKGADAIDVFKKTSQPSWQRSKPRSQVARP